jgi:hypothetical protein
MESWVPAGLFAGIVIFEICAFIYCAVSRTEIHHEFSEHDDPTVPFKFPSFHNMSIQNSKGDRTVPFNFTFFHNVSIPFSIPIQNIQNSVIDDPILSPHNFLTTYLAATHYFWQHIWRDKSSLQESGGYSGMPECTMAVKYHLINSEVTSSDFMFRFRSRHSDSEILRNNGPFVSGSLIGEDWTLSNFEKRSLGLFLIGTLIVDHGVTKSRKMSDRSSTEDLEYMSCYGTENF